MMSQTMFGLTAVAVALVVASITLVAGVVRDDDRDGGRIVLAIALIGIIAVSSAILGSYA